MNIRTAFFCFFILHIGCLTAGELSFKHHIIDAEGPQNPWMKLIADIDADGLPDVIIGGQKGPLVWYRYPDWHKALISEGGYQTVDGEAGDVDGDGDLDVVMGGLFWYENPLPSGDPAAKAWKEHKVAAHPTHDIELGDLDGDGDLDIVSRDQSAFSNPRGDSIYIWRQEKPDQWTPRVILCTGGEGLALADMDRDQDPDIIIGGMWFENPKDDIVTGKWQETRFGSWHPNASVQTADINGDGRVDIILTPSELKEDTYRISWFEAPGNPRSSGWKEHIIADNVETVVHAVQAADMDLDGNIDVIIAEMHQGRDPDEVIVFRNLGKGQRWQRQVLSDKGSHLIRIGDIGNDGDIDIMGANWSGDYQPVELWENQSSNP